MKTTYDEAASDFESHASQSAWNAYARVHPEAYEKMMKRPTLVALKWRKPE